MKEHIPIFISFTAGDVILRLSRQPLFSGRQSNFQGKKTSVFSDNPAQHSNTSVIHVTSTI